MYDIITVGSATVDVFVKTSTKNVKIINTPEHDVCYPVGSKILIEDLHFDTGGGGTNTGTAFSRLGFKTGWIGKVGNDSNSATILEVVRKEKIDFLGCQGNGLAGYSVILAGIGNDRTILAFKGINDKLSSSDFDWNALNTKWFYLSSMMNQSWKTLEKIAKFAKKNGINYAFNPSMYLAQQGLRSLRKVVDGCSVLVLNKEEAQAMSNKNVSKEVLQVLQEYARIVVVTDGANGGSAFDGEKFYSIIPNRIKVVETTGAGDAFAAGFVAGLMHQQTLAKALQTGLAESESVIQHIGAKNILLTQAELEKSLSKRAGTVSVGVL